MATTTTAKVIIGVMTGTVKTMTGAAKTMTGTAIATATGAAEAAMITNGAAVRVTVREARIGREADPKIFAEAAAAGAMTG